MHCVALELRRAEPFSLALSLQVAVELPFQILFPVVFCLIVYWPIGFSSRFPILAGFVVLLNNVGQALGMLVGCGFENPEVCGGAQEQEEMRSRCSQRLLGLCGV